MQTNKSIGLCLFVICSQFKNQKMKLKNIYLILVLALSIAATSCTEDESEAPIISDLELGAQNSHIGHLGSDLHIEAGILAEGKIKNIRISIHHEEEEGEEHKAIAQSATDDHDHEHEWEVDSTYTGVYANIINTSFHEHIEIPADAEEGEYHFHMYVTDLEGQQTIVEEELEIKVPNADENFPSITITDAPSEDQIFTIGQEISITGSVADVQGLAGIFIGIVSESAALEDSEVTSSNAITLLHTHDFQEPYEYNFNASLSVGDANDNNITPNAINWESGNYYILVKVPGVDGELSFSEHYPIVISVD